MMKLISWLKSLLKVLMAGGLIYIAYSAVFMKNVDSYAGDASSSINYERVIPGTFEVLVSCDGVISAVASVNVKSRVGGSVEYLKLMEGDYVKKGDVVANIDRRNILLKVKQSEADLKAAKAQLERSKLSYEIDARNYDSQIRRAMSNVEFCQAGFKLMERGNRREEITQGQAQLDMARANYENDRKNYGRQKELYDKSLISKAALDSAKANMDVSLASVKSAEGKFLLLKNGYQREEIQKSYSQYEVALYELESAKIKSESLKLLEKEIKNIEAAVQRAEILYQDAMEQLKDTTVLAPISGIVTQKWVDEGGIVTSGTMSAGSEANIVTISDLSSVLITASVGESNIHKLAGMPEARVIFDAFYPRVFKARLTKVGPRVYYKENVPVVDVTLEMKADTDAVKVGMTAKTEIVIMSKPGVKMISCDSVIEKNGKKYVKIAAGASKISEAQMKEVKLGESNGEHSVLMDGLDADDVFYSGLALKKEKDAKSGKSSSDMPPPPPPM